MEENILSQRAEFLEAPGWKARKPIHLCDMKWKEQSWICQQEENQPGSGKSNLEAQLPLLKSQSIQGSGLVPVSSHGRAALVEAPTG